ncbi:uncharacterized protein LOC6732228 [Drosophila simulans]|uniref:GD23909 n=1 Tax=Drosophila simulans TaxID=7240 RepID=B4Q536_DROSI|nr:uncharacterized protein LOC6732228 [Drosophila simulans]EDX04942.1 GD23909 [Drosophila simulans]KMY90128.1 uncharacterized protein Dsimw501_GD23909 [Drosophila simulans]
MLSSRSDTSGDDISITAQAEKRVDSIKAPSVGWNVENKDVQIPEAHLTHKQISKCNFFEEYIKRTKCEYGQTSGLKRFRSEELAIKQEDQIGEHRSSSLSRLSDVTIKPTCEVSSQTSWTAADESNMDSKDLEAKLAAVCGGGIDPKTDKPSKIQQHTIHIEVESVTSATAMQRPPLHQRMWQVVVQTASTIVAFVYTIGENLPMALFIVLCLWCLYLLLSHFYGNWQTNVNQQNELKRNLLPSK